MCLPFNTYHFSQIGRTRQISDTSFLYFMFIHPTSKGVVAIKRFFSISGTNFRIGTNLSID